MHQKRMKILVVTPSFHPHVGGLENFTKMLYASLQRYNIEPIILTTGDSHVLARVETIDGMKVHRFAFTLTDQSSLKWLAFVFRMPINLLRIYRLLRTENIYIVHIHFPFYYTIYFILLQRLKKYKLILSFHGSDLLKYTSDYKILRFVIGKVCHRSDKIIFNSHYMNDEFGKIFPHLDTCSGKVIYNGYIRTDNSYNTKNTVYRPFVLGVGRLVVNKGFTELLHIYANIRQSHPNIDLIIIGDGEARNNLENTIDALGLKDSVILPGALSMQELQWYYEKCTLFISTSHYEGFGLTIVEAMAHGKAVIATNVGAVSELIKDNVTGCLVELGDHESLISKIEQLLTNDKLRLQIGRAAQNEALNRFTFDRTVTEYRTLYRNLST